MMGKMVKNMIYFVVLLAVVLMSFGVSRQAILFPNNEPSWRLIRDVYFQPYFMLYGEVFADDIDPPCGEDPSQSPCVTGHWVTPITMSMYLLIANILLINLLIAVFNNIFIEVNAVSHQVWMFQRFTVVMEYQQKPVLPPPLIAGCHFYSMLKYFIRKAKGLEVQRDNGLKLFLEKDDLERLYDFEEECIEGYFHEQEIVLHQSTDERIKSTTNRVENMSQKIEDINQKENMQTATVQSIDFRLRKVEESAEQILSHLAVIHRFMSAHTQENSQVSTTNIPVEMRLRTVSETDGMSTLQVNNRRKFNRSLTEVRPDAYIFDDGLHFEVVTVPEENELIKSRETLIEQISSRKISVQSEESDVYAPLTLRLPSAEPLRKLSSFNIRQETATSTESKDTLTPFGNSDEQTLVGDAGSEENIVDLNLETAKQRAVRQRSTSAVCRRNSESYANRDLDRSQMSLNQLVLTRRQLSVTQSEPDSGNDPTIAAAAKPVIPVKPSRNLLLQFHTQYTSITDELESVCHMIASPTTSMTGPAERPKNLNELSNAEFAALIEKQHLKECEEHDYMILQDLFKDRSVDTDDSTEGITLDFGQRHPLRRETAIEFSPSKLPIGSRKPETDVESVMKSEPFYSRHLSTDCQPQRGRSPHSYGRTTSELLNPSQPDSSLITRKSSESLQKNSSTETDYSALPYKVIKQSSNDTTTSMTGSLNIDNASLVNDMSMEGEISNTTVIETSTTPIPTTSFGAGDKISSFGDQSLAMRSSMLKKQFSVDQSKYSPQRTVSESEKADIAFKSSLKPLTTSKLGLDILQESSSSVEDSKDERTNIPAISTDLVQDEIAKLSSNIKSSTESEKDPPYNETMC